MVALLCSCGPSKEEMEKRAQQKEDSIEMATAIHTDNVVKEMSKGAPEILHYHRKWSAIETGLPTGTIISRNCGSEPYNPKDNYVEIKKPDGYNTIVRDIDEDLYITLEEGDLIE
jgi:hypothetical protein